MEVSIVLYNYEKHLEIHYLEDVYRVPIKGFLSSLVNPECLDKIIINGLDSSRYRVEFLTVTLSYEIDTKAIPRALVLRLELSYRPEILLPADEIHNIVLYKTKDKCHINSPTELMIKEDKLYLLNLDVLYDKDAEIKLGDICLVKVKNENGRIVNTIESKELCDFISKKYDKTSGRNTTMVDELVQRRFLLIEEIMAFLSTKVRWMKFVQLGNILYLLCCYNDRIYSRRKFVMKQCNGCYKELEISHGDTNPEKFNLIGIASVNDRYICLMEILD